MPTKEEIQEAIGPNYIVQTWYQVEHDIVWIRFLTLDKKYYWRGEFTKDCREMSIEDLRDRLIKPALSTLDAYVDDVRSGRVIPKPREFDIDVSD